MDDFMKSKTLQEIKRCLQELLIMKYSITDSVYNYRQINKTILISLELAYRYKRYLLAEERQIVYEELVRETSEGAPHTLAERGVRERSNWLPFYAPDSMTIPIKDGNVLEFYVSLNQREKNMFHDLRRSCFYHSYHVIGRRDNLVKTTFCETAKYEASIATKVAKFVLMHDNINVYPFSDEFRRRAINELQRENMSTNCFECAMN